ncbi:MAG: cupredoxin family protein [Rubrivivax sp.]
MVRAAHAHGTAGHAAARPRSTTAYDWGREGEARRVQRTVVVTMSDRMRFTPDLIELRQGQTLRLRVRNAGRAMHELVLGTRDELERHAELMKRFPGMEHDEPYMAHVPPGGQADIVWTFDRAGTFMYGCLVPGHWEAGMQGQVVVRPAMSSSPPAPR